MMKKGLVLAFMAVSMMIGGNAHKIKKNVLSQKPNARREREIAQTKIVQRKNATIRNLAANKKENVLIENKTVLV